MRRRRIDVRVVTAAGPEAVYRLLADGSSYPRWSPIESFELERAGDPPPEGVGAIRVFRRARTTGRDQILELVANRSIRYSSHSSLPVRDYEGVVELEAGAGGTTIHWHSSFFPKVRGTGWIVERGMARFLRKCTHGLAEYAAVSDATRSVRE